MRAKLVMFFAAISLAALFIWPMWRITLVAPQYPHGVTMYIWINQITGNEPATLQNINILNHYIGMKYIVPDEIPEFSFIKYIVMGLIALGIVVALIGKGYLFLGWGILVALLGALGIYDFYLWEYDYGHNLSDTAPITIPGMVYQPPLIGKKALLNFIAYSWPWIGGWFIGVSLILSYLAYRINKKKVNHEEEPRITTRNRVSVAS